MSAQQTHGTSVVPVWVPIPVQELGSESEWSREEKLSKIAEILKCQQQRHCFMKMDTEPTQPLLVPLVKPFCRSEELLLEYEREVYQAQGALPASVVDQAIEARLQEFLTKTPEPAAPKSCDPSTKRRPRAKAEGTAWDELYKK